MKTGLGRGQVIRKMSVHVPYVTDSLAASATDYVTPSVTASVTDSVTTSVTSSRDIYL